MVWNSEAVFRDNDAEEAVEMGRTGAVMVKIAHKVWESQTLTVSSNGNADDTHIELWIGTHDISSFTKTSGFLFL